MHWIYAHIIGDWFFQNDWMAVNKKKNWLICLLHVIVYLLPFLLCHLTYWQLILIGIQHFILDHTNFVGWYCKVTGSEKFVATNGIFFPWSLIIIDNMMHILWIAFVVAIPSLWKTYI